MPSSNRSSFERERSASNSAPTTVTPDADDPRLRRYGQYKSERELYAQFSTQKSASPANSYSANTGSYAAANTNSYPASNGGYATANTAGAAAGSYAAYNHSPAPTQPPAQTGPAPSTHMHPTNPSLKYTSYPAPSASSPYVQPAPTYTSSSSAAPPAPVQRPQQQVPPLPSAAVGAETKEVYTQVMSFITTRCPYANLQVFKDNCRLFGQDAMSLDAFYSYISSICSKQLMKELVPQLVRLLPTQDKRERLWVRPLCIHAICLHCVDGWTLVLTVLIVCAPGNADSILSRCAALEGVRAAVAGRKASWLKRDFVCACLELQERPDEARTTTRESSFKQISECFDAPVLHCCPSCRTIFLSRQLVERLGGCGMSDSGPQSHFD